MHTLMDLQRAVALVPEKQIYAYDSLTLTSINRKAYMGTPLEDMEPPCEHKKISVGHISERNSKVRPPWVASPPLDSDYLWPQLHHMSRQKWFGTHQRDGCHHFTIRPQQKEGFPGWEYNIWWNQYGHTPSILQDVRSGMMGFQR